VWASLWCKGRESGCAKWQWQSQLSWVPAVHPSGGRAGSTTHSQLVRVHHGVTCLLKGPGGLSHCVGESLCGHMGIPHWSTALHAWLGPVDGVHVDDMYQDTLPACRDARTLNMLQFGCGPLTCGWSVLAVRVIQC
jgi:hypothetical protein